MADNKNTVSAVKIVRGLSDLRDQALLCDVHLVAEGETFPVHRVVLAAASPYFQAMFTGAFKESRLNTVTLQEVSAKGLKVVLDAIYTTEVRLTDDVVEHVLHVAKLMQMDEIIEACEEFIVKNISEKTCLRFLIISEKYELEKSALRAEEYILENFEAFAATDDFCELSKERLCTYISDDRLRLLNGEIEVFRAAAKWSDHNSNLPKSSVVDILCYIRFPQIPPELLVDEVLPHILMERNVECRPVVSQALKFHYNRFTQPLQTGQQYQSRGEETLMIIPCEKTENNRESDNERNLGTTIQMLKLQEEELFETDTTKVVPITFVRESLAVVEHSHFVFVFGVDRKSFSSVALRYNPMLDQWIDLKPAPQPATIGSAVTKSGEHIYMFGGVFVQKNDTNYQSRATNSAWRYSIRSNTWEELSAMPQTFEFARAVSYGDTIYLVGNAMTQNHFGYYHPDPSVTYAFDTRANLWIKKASMHQRRKNFSLEMLESRMFVCGGNENGSSIEYYDTTDDQWALVPDVDVTNRFHASSFVRGKKIYIVGGAETPNENEGSHFVTCLDYDTHQLVTSSLPFKFANHACVLLTAMRT